MQRIVTTLLLILLFALPGFTQTEKKRKKRHPRNSRRSFQKESLSETKHSVQIDGKTISYNVVAGNIVLKEENSRPKASIFFIAYTKEGVSDTQTRPVMFSFNGGPGSSSVWLHLGVLGPRRVKIQDDGAPYPPPFTLEDNAYSLLDATDLVFIDPVSTGFSRAVPGEDPKQYHGVQEDIESVGEFIRLYTTRYKRWNSPKFMIGESYGTTRAAGLVNYLQERHGMYFNGVILVSVAIDFATLEFTRGNDLPFMLFVPRYTATAWYHKKLPPDLQSLDLKTVVDQSRSFMLNEYGPALLKGELLSESEKKTIAAKLARFTGLSEEYVLQSNLRVPDFRFFKELQRDRRLITGRLDSRFTGRDIDAAGESAENDPSYSAIQGVFTATFNDYVRRELKYETDTTYEIITGQIRKWNQEPQFSGRFINTADALRLAINQNPNLRVFVANGYYDLATPFPATEYTFRTWDWNHRFAAISRWGITKPAT